MEVKKNEICMDGAAAMILAALEAEGLKKRDLAAKMGTTRQLVSQSLSRPEKGMRYDSFERMAKALGYEIILRKK